MKNQQMSLVSYEELDDVEARAISGGIGWAFLFATVVLIPMISNPTQHYEALLAGIKEGYEATKI
jgi:hypothetical protein